MHALVLGLAITNEAVVRRLQARGDTVVVVDDRPGEAARGRALDLGIELHVTDEVDVDVLLAGSDVVLPSPGVPISHPILVSAETAGVPVWSEFELAARWDDRPIVAVTGTNGKTTVTTLIAEMLTESGRVVALAGNNDVPLVDALADESVEVFVVEASSFRLQFTDRFRAAVAVWLNLAPDHLDWHPDLAHYAAAKFRMWANQQPGDVALANADDHEVMAWAAKAPGTVQTFGLGAADFRIEDEKLVGPDGLVIAEVARLPRRLPHDLSNALAASAAAIASGVDVAAVRAVLERFGGLPHRVERVGDAGGVTWYDDSKATTPASVVAGVSGFSSVVLVAGGRNKGLDLSELRVLAPALRGVVAIGESAADIRSTFEGLVPVADASTMDEVVAVAATMARDGDAVVLSPGCASYDWYRNYGERGDDFARAVRDHLGLDTATVVS